MLLPQLRIYRTTIFGGVRDRKGSFVDKLTSQPKLLSRELNLVLYLLHQDDHLPDRIRRHVLGAALSRRCGREGRAEREGYGDETRADPVMGDEEKALGVG